MVQVLARAWSVAALSAVATTCAALVAGNFKEFGVVKKKREREKVPRRAVKIPKMRENEEN